MSESGLLLGTPGYLAPEQAQADSVTERADLFSLGCVLYEMCTGHRPFTGPNVLAILAAGQPRSPSTHEVDATVPRPLSNLVMRLLAQDPNNRPSRGAAVAQALRALEAGAPVKPGRLWPLLGGRGCRDPAGCARPAGPSHQRSGWEDNGDRGRQRQESEYDSKTGKVTINPLVPPDRKAPPANPLPRKRPFMKCGRDGSGVGSAPESGSGPSGSSKR